MKPEHNYFRFASGGMGQLKSMHDLPRDIDKSGRLLFSLLLCVQRTLHVALKLNITVKVPRHPVYLFYEVGENTGMKQAAALALGRRSHCHFVRA